MPTFKTVIHPRYKKSGRSFQSKDSDHPQQTIPVYSDLLLRELFRGKRKIRFQARHLLCPRYDAYYRRIPENLQ